MSPSAATRLPLAVEHDDLERGGLLLIEVRAFEQRLDADAGLLQVDRDSDAALDGAAAGLAQAQDDVASSGFAVCVTGGNVMATWAMPSASVLVGGVERLAHRLDRLVGLTELEAGVAGNVLGRWLDDDVAFDGEVGGGRTVKIAPVALMVCVSCGDNAAAGGSSLRSRRSGTKSSTRNDTCVIGSLSGSVCSLARHVPVCEEAASGSVMSRPPRPGPSTRSGNARRHRGA